MNMVFYAHFTQIGMRTLHSIEYGFVQIYISVDTSLEVLQLSKNLCLLLSDMCVFESILEQTVNVHIFHHSTLRG